MPSYNRKAPARHLKLTKLCKFFAEGKCDRGSLCTFAHTTDEVRDQPDLTKTRLCKDFMKLGRCDEGAACKFAHGREEMQNRREALANFASSTPPGHRQGKAALKRDPTPCVPASMAAEVQGVHAPGAAAMSQSKVPDQTLKGMALAAHLLARCISMHQQPSNYRDSTTDSVRSRRSTVDHQCPPFVCTLSSGSTSPDVDNLSFAHTSSGATCSSVETSPSSSTSWSLQGSPSDMHPQPKSFFQQSGGFWRKHGVVLKNTFIDQAMQMDVESLRRCRSAPAVR
eukprot:TRINITY_DN3339_c0_g1_i1.p1 TRINITY_DN3339_c0_g1~~TRINITY_DN3339_c0_g1_i1.p1  ORF type:complete len:283 (-),score=27.67 TRINITY_DN3339_c0_g1_i1:52-900(-)